MSNDLSNWINHYRNTAEGNDFVFERFTGLVDGVEFLKEHKDFVEANNWGMSPRAFHYLWFLLLEDCHQRFGPFRAIDVGVYMGQMISLWGLIAENRGMDISITAVSPFTGTQPEMRWIRDFRKQASSRDETREAAGKPYQDDDRLRRAQAIFEKFAGPFDRVEVHHGLSTDHDILAAVTANRFGAVYIGGDHKYQTVKRDIENYAPLVRPGGYLVMDDGAFLLPTARYANTPYHRGYESVARACEAIEPMGFRNVLNVGHNRVYRREEDAA